MSEKESAQSVNQKDAAIVENLIVDLKKENVQTIADGIVTLSSSIARGTPEGKEALISKVSGIYMKRMDYLVRLIKMLGEELLKQSSGENYLRRAGTIKQGGNEKEGISTYGD